MGIIISCILGIVGCIADAIMAVVALIVDCIACIFTAIVDVAAALCVSGANLGKLRSGRKEHNYVTAAHPELDTTLVATYKPAGPMAGSPKNHTPLFLATVVSLWGVFECIADAIMTVVSLIVDCIACIFTAIVDAAAALCACLTCGLCCAAAV
ncbi:hypothetical protein FKP32DRAFT_1679850 [Trametes sanguinea]|nr:hypothetical protein FKP32DRAFT_1679850 [Trametes sanguinea]